MLYVLYCTTVIEEYEMAITEDIVVGIFDSMKLALKAKREFDENFDGDCPYCDEWETYIREYELNVISDLL